MTDVFIVGAGPAGLAAALAARRKGLGVTIADAQQPAIDKACGEGLMPDALEALCRLGVAIRAEESFPFRGIGFLNADDKVHAHFPKGPALGIRRTALHATMVQHALATGVQMRWGATVTDVGTRWAEVNGRKCFARWIVGADGSASRVRKWAGLESAWRNSRRFGFRRHYRVTPWSDCMEIHWGPGFQIYTTPIGPNEVCVAVISRDPKLRLDFAVEKIPALRERLAVAETLTEERGAVTATLRLRRVVKGSLALIGDASGSVDAITGEGLCLAFKQAAALADAMVAGDLGAYQHVHGRLYWRPAFMAELMLLLDKSSRLRARAVRALAQDPTLFSNMLAMHVGDVRPAAFAGALGALLLTI